MKKIVLILLISTITSIVAYKLAYFIGEKYFFDKLFYRKSTQHGYIKAGDWKNIASSLTREEPLQHRLFDLHDLMYEEEKILGKSTYGEKFNIAIIGDSMTYGLGVKESETFASILEKKLNKIKPTKVYNYSFPGDDIINNFTKYKKAKETKQIDLFIFSIVDNDLIFNDIDRYPQNKEAYSEILSLCEKEPVFFEYSNIASREKWVEKIYYPSFSEEHSNLCFLEKIISRLNKSNTLFFSFSYNPDQQDIEEAKPDSVILKSLLIFSKYNKIIAIDNDGFILDPTKKKLLKYTEISKIEQHPSKETHKNYAEIIFDEIYNNPRWKFIK